MESLVILLGTFVLFWFLFIRPQQRRMREHQNLVASLEVGDEVVTSSGIFGTIRSIDGDTVRVEISPGTEVRMARQAITRRVIEQGT